MAIRLTLDRLAKILEDRRIREAALKAKGVVLFPPKALRRRRPRRLK